MIDQYLFWANNVIADETFSFSLGDFYMGGQSFLGFHVQ